MLNSVYFVELKGLSREYFPRIGAYRGEQACLVARELFRRTMGQNVEIVSCEDYRAMECAAIIAKQFCLPVTTYNVFCSSARHSQCLSAATDQIKEFGRHVDVVIVVHIVRDSQLPKYFFEIASGYPTKTRRKILIEGVSAIDFVEVRLDNNSSAT